MIILFIISGFISGRSVEFSAISKQAAKDFLIIFERNAAQEIASIVDAVLEAVLVCDKIGKILKFFHMEFFRYYFLCREYDFLFVVPDLIMCSTNRDKTREKGFKCS
jgi:hypothetical protein